MVSPEPSLLDHRHILFILVGEQEEKVNYRNPWTTRWASYRKELQDSGSRVSAASHCLFT
jgi:hypothetical protein